MEPASLQIRVGKGLSEIKAVFVEVESATVHINQDPDEAAWPEEAVLWPP